MAILLAYIPVTDKSLFSVLPHLSSSTTNLTGFCCPLNGALFYLLFCFVYKCFGITVNPNSLINETLYTIQLASSHDTDAYDR